MICKSTKTAVKQVFERQTDRRRGGRTDILDLWAGSGFMRDFCKGFLSNIRQCLILKALSNKFINLNYN